MQDRQSTSTSFEPRLRTFVGGFLAERSSGRHAGRQPHPILMGEFKRDTATVPPVTPFPMVLRSQLPVDPVFAAYVLAFGSAAIACFASLARAR